MRKLIMAGVLLTAFASCKPKYSCFCHVQGSHDTTYYLGKMSSTDAHTACLSINRTHPNDSCGVIDSK